MRDLPGRGGVSNNYSRYSSIWYGSYYLFGSRGVWIQFNLDTTVIFGVEEGKNTAAAAAADC